MLFGDFLHWNFAAKIPLEEWRTLMWIQMLSEQKYTYLSETRNHSVEISIVEKVFPSLKRKKKEALIVHTSI